MSSPKSVTRIITAAAALPLVLGAVVAPAAHAAESAAKPSAKYTMAQVKKHNKASDCWAVIGKNVYRLTAWIPQHPGGSRAIAALCGTNATAAFAQRHGSDPFAKAQLARYRIGTL